MSKSKGQVYKPDDWHFNQVNNESNILYIWLDLFCAWHYRIVVASCSDYTVYATGIMGIFAKL
jgi:hypothetical protein